MLIAFRKKGRLRVFASIAFIFALSAIINTGIGFTDSAEAAFTVTACTDCHATPPVESGTRGTPAGAVVGSHAKHDSESIACIVCHGDTTSGETNFAHSNRKIEFVNPIYSGTGAYSKGTSVTQLNDMDGSGLGSCSSIYCHSTGQSTTDGSVSTPTYSSPDWGDAATGACGTCHKVSEGTGLTSGSHGEHLGTTGVSGCADCHTGAENNASAYNSANHVNDLIDVANTYTKAGTPGNGYGTCSTASCHDDGTGNPAVSPTWGADAANCTACHIAAPSTGSHSKHLAVSDVACNDCHDGAVESTTFPAQHQDGNVDVYDTVSGDLGYPENKTKGSAFTNCTTAVCHEDGRGTLKASPAWGSTPAKCTLCHGVIPSTGSHSVLAAAGAVCNDCHKGAVQSTTFPEQHRDGNVDIYETVSGDLGYTENKTKGTAFTNCTTSSCHDDGTGNIVASPDWGVDAANCSQCHAVVPTTGSHTKHLSTTNYNTAECGDCHDNTVVSTTAPTQHTDGNVDVYDSASGDLGYTENKTKGSAYTTCSTAYCHSSGQSTTDKDSSTPTYATVTWGGTVTCGICHKVTEASGLTSGSHAEHLGTTGVSGCSDCHTGAADNASSYNSTSHVNALIDVSNTYTAGGAPGNDYGTCSTAACHDDGTGTPAATPTWGVNAANCTQCHAAAPTTGSHSAHLDESGVACNDCHDNAVESTTAPAQHLDGNVDVFDSSSGDLGYTENKTKGSAYTTCTTSACHDDGTGTPTPSPTWGTDAANCTQCHAGAPTTGSHTSHLAASGVACNDCHDNAVESTTAPTQHLDTNVDVFNSTSGDLGYPENKTKGSAVSNCTTASCHDDGRGNLVASSNWGVNDTACTSCHAAVPTTGSHTAHRVRHTQSNQSRSCSVGIHT